MINNVKSKQKKRFKSVIVLSNMVQSNLISALNLLSDFGFFVSFLTLSSAFSDFLKIVLIRGLVLRVYTSG